MQAPRTILFIAVSRIGDTLFATPAIRAVAQAYPDAEITVLGHPNRAEILQHLPFVHQVDTITKKLAPWKDRLAFGKRYNLAFVYNFDEPLVAYALRVAHRVVAFRQANPALNARLYRCVAPPAFQSEHAVRQLLRLPEATDIRTTDLRLAYRYTDHERRQARQRLEIASASDARPLVGLQVASFPTKGYRDWPVENFAELSHKIAAAWPQAHFLIFGGSSEKSRTEWLATELGDQATLYAGRLTLRETAALMSWLDLYVGIDTGPTHIMSTYDIPMVALYHCLSSSAHTGPLDHPMAYLIDHPSTDTSDCQESSAMADIGIDRVMAEVARALTEHPPAPR
ncbi:glycosyltransferase family 9 protein [Acidihalobacter ferrooxydans]|uniref:Uncharacterized protein n=1 Tax=Acidihalobacter ferrooxydans TaxID=1765967 RepID=A0A1P8UJ53_9GAMM|nr:glycosyltransferase family 9 protein [Acidihalobacter ferrooxydans]APZ43811.1 hypothetical protein BW247_12530 [Acidihalobacter ferrooxydans]